jgi:hypothetical protein
VDTEVHATEAKKVDLEVHAMETKKVVTEDLKTRERVDSSRVLKIHPDAMTVNAEKVQLLVDQEHLASHLIKNLN